MESEFPAPPAEVKVNDHSTDHIDPDVIKSGTPEKSLADELEDEAEASVTHAPSSDDDDVTGESGKVVVIEEELEPSTEEKSASDAANSVILDRFSSWRQRANENATAIWKKQREQVQATVAANPGLFIRTPFNTDEKVNDEAESTNEPVNQTSSNESGVSVQDASTTPGSASGNKEEVAAEDKSETNPSTRPRVAALQWAAVNMVENVQAQTGYFRGRYNSKDEKDLASLETPTKAMPPTSTQTSRILQSPQALHLQELQKKIAPHEYVMLLGRGMLGVNLKQPYLKHQGVYVDYLVAQGAADKSKVIQVGDLLVSVGDNNMLKGTIMNVPKAIADAKRPVHLVLSTPGAINNPSRINYLDVAIALIHKYHQDKPEPATRDEDGGISEKDESPAMELVQAASFDRDEQETDEIPADLNVPNYDTQVADVFVSPAAPPAFVRDALASQVAKRGNDSKFHVDELMAMSADHEDLRNALEHAFLLCATDGRRFPFLARQLSAQDAAENGNGPPPSALLMLFLEMVNFSDLFEVTPSSRRKSNAERIATKFFLPTRVDNDLVPPMFDFHHIVPDKAVRELEVALQSERVTRTIFHEFQKASVTRLSSKPFLSFLSSNECARMRAFLRNTAPFCNIPLNGAFESLVDGSNDHTRNYFCYLIVYLLCQVEKDGVGECDQVFEPRGGRIEEAASGICAALFLRRHLLPLSKKVQEMKTDLPMRTQLVEAYELLWEVFLSPGIGALEHSALTSETEDKLEEIRGILREVREFSRDIIKDGTPSDDLVEQLLDQNLLRLFRDLAHECVYDYAVNFHPKFREHKFHEWLCTELSKAQEPEDLDLQSFALPSGCVKRLLRKADFPVGVSEHKPNALAQVEEALHSTEKATISNTNAECAIVFGTGVGLDQASSVPGTNQDNSIRRYACQSLGPADVLDFTTLQPEEVPATVESYASVPNCRPKPFGDFLKRSSLDGWDVSIVNFCVPRADTSSPGDQDSTLFGVSVVFQQRKDRLKSDSGAIELQLEAAPHVSATQENGRSLTSVPVSAACKVFSEHLTGNTWVDRVSQEVSETNSNVSIGLALVSKRNVIFAMRQTLENWLQSFFGANKLEQAKCQCLVNLLGNFVHQNVEADTLRCLLEQHMARASKPWLERPIPAQRDDYLQLAGSQLIRTLSPIPLALLFVTALLEQKIVFSSSRTSILMAATTALAELVKPLKWCHLLVPRVPASLASDLLQYPAPFILGMPSEEDGIMELIRDLPQDVTLVDLDVGRVILAPSFPHDSEFGRGTPNNTDTSKALRSQTLYLAQSLGSVFGRVVDPDTWCCDSIPSSPSNLSPFDRLKMACRNFLEELLAGTTACCFWLEEAGSPGSDATVLFDEDRFFHIKNLRHSNDYSPLFKEESSISSLSLGLDDFDLILEVFLRSQALNYYISTTSKDKMVFFP